MKNPNLEKKIFLAEEGVGGGGGEVGSVVEKAASSIGK